MTTSETTPVNGSEPRDRIDQYLRESGLDGPATTVVPLTGDASDRRYFRILRPDRASIVLALHAGPIAFESLPFVNVAELLRQLPIPVPSIVGHSDALGVLALEDLGDVTLQAHLGTAPPTEHAALYRQAIEIIETLQRRGAELADQRWVPYRMAFDIDKLTWELDFFARHFIEGVRGAALSTAERTALDEEFGSIAAELAGLPRVLCHRDYHSRNLMVHEHRLYVIDFQDARQGPDSYDLVSLLRDSYVDLDEGTVTDLVAHFLALKGAARVAAPEFRRQFDLMAIQRNLKALGTFGYQTMTRRNTAYIQYIPRTLRYVRTNLEHYSRFARLRGLLAEHVEELR